ncbi:MAG: putative ubiquinone biosynthesis monooxygenase [Peltula sp. TS41687]|nr:MAG: putative ubiquinone biosynthesis monooxygenase [Peltula sp. TS41687]
MSPLPRSLLPLSRPMLRRTHHLQRLRHHKRRYAAPATAPDPTAESSSPEIYDVVCIGGGPAGLSVLTALRASEATSHLKLALVERQDLSKLRGWTLSSDQYSNRVSSLTPSSVAFLEAIGAWSHVRRSRVQPYSEMQVWDGVTGARIAFDWPSTANMTTTTTTTTPNVAAEGSRGPDGGKTIAYMTENLNLTSSLLDRLDELGGVSMFDDSRVENIGYGPESEHLDLSDWPVVELSGGKSLAARLLIGADGAESPVRRFAGIESRGWDYDSHGVVATVRLEGNGWGRGEQDKIAYQRFLPTGPVALLPLPDNFSTLVWSTRTPHASHLKSLSTADFIAMVNAAFRLSPVDLAYLHTQPHGQAEEVAWREQHTPYDAQLIPQRIVDVQQGTVASFPLRMRHADTYVGERVALVGDAAHTIHPLAGQGLNQGQADVQVLAQTIQHAVLHGQDIGTLLSLAPYTSQRYAANNLLMGVVDKLHKLYSVSSGPLVPLRSWGLRGVNALGPLKAFFMSRAAASGGGLI